MPSNSFQAALAHHQAGRLPQAEAICRQLLQVEPNHFEALHLLGLIAHQAGKSKIAAELIGKAIGISASSQMCCNLGVILYEQGRFSEAEASYRRALELKPDLVIVHNNLGNTLRNLNRPAEAETSFRQALKFKPDYVNAHCNLGLILNDQGRFLEAEASYRRALALKPDYASALSGLGNALTGLGQLDEAVASYRKALIFEPVYAEAHNNLGNALRDLGRLDEAEASYLQALSIKPDYAEAHNNLGNVLRDIGRIDEAFISYRRALEINPNLVKAYCNLGNALRDLGRFDEAEASYLRALAINPDYAEAHNNLGNVLKDLGRIDEASISYRRALEINPNIAEAHCSLGLAMQDTGQLAGAAASFLRALELKPGYAAACSNLLFLYGYHALLGPDEYLVQARNWEQSCVPEKDRATACHKGFQRKSLAGRRLRVGYVSGDFRQHAVSYFIEQLFTYHDKARIELFAYSNNAERDAVTGRLQALVEHWVPVAGISDVAAMKRIEADGIDVLVDLSGHTGHNRLGVFARRAAPVQAHYLGFMASTGLTEMDYWIGDEILTPAETDSHFNEQVWRLPRVWVSYQGKADAPLPNWQPSRDGAVWLGSFNNLGKLTPATLALWARVLHALPEGRLLLKTKALADAGNRRRILDVFSEHGISPDRIELQDINATPDWTAHMAYYDRLDIALDPVGGLGGGTTTCDALWMGVPVITLEGDRMASRMTASMLGAIGQTEWIARSEAEYADKVVALARDVERRKTLRIGQRDRMDNSPLCDAKDLAVSLENAYFAMFDKKYCQGKYEAGAALQPQQPAISVTQYAVKGAEPTPDECKQLVALFNSGRHAELENRAHLLAEQYPDSGFVWKVMGLSLQAQDKDALPALQKAAELLPDEAEAHYNLGNALRILGRFDAAAASFRRALEIKPDFAEAHSNLGVALQEQGKLDDAVNSCQRAISLKPNLANAHYNLGISLRAQGKLDAAIDSFRKALSLKPYFADAYSNMGLALNDQGKLDEANECYRRAIQIKPDYAEAYCNLGSVLKDQDKLDEAVECYRRAIQVKPNFAEVHGNLGNALIEMGQPDDAVASYRRALELKPDYAEAHNNLGNAMQEVGQLDGAVASYRRALELKPDYAEAHNNLGNAMQEVGQLDAAVASYRRALEIKSDFAKAQKNLGDTLCYLSDIDQAIDAYQKALAIDPRNLGLEAGVSLAILYYLDGSIQQCKSMLDISRPINASTASAQKNARAYWCYLNSLLDQYEESNRERYQQEDIDVLYVIGESHSLAAHGVVVSYHDRKMRCNAEWIEGCKQWHLGNNKPNKFKYKFESIMKMLPRKSTILLLIGEIDCRPEEGIIKASKKSQGMPLEDVAKTTAATYISYVTEIAARFEHRVIVGGVPATNRRLDMLDTETAEQLVKVIKLFNAILKYQTLAAGMNFLDVYALTDRGDGIASGEWHIDSNHLRHSAVVEAFGRHCHT